MQIQYLMTVLKELSLRLCESIREMSGGEAIIILSHKIPANLRENREHVRKLEWEREAVDVLSIQDSYIK